MGPLFSSPPSPTPVYRSHSPVLRRTPSPPPPPKLTVRAWRDILQVSRDWREEAYTEFKETLARRFGDENVEKANILLLGAIGSGKSSFVNSVLSVSKGRIVNKAYSGEATKSYTTKYGQYKDRNFFKNFILHDSMGVEPAEGEGFHISDVVYMIQGKIPKNYKFNPRSAISEKDPCFNAHPSEKEKVHCVIFFVDATTLFADIPKNLVQKIGRLQDEIKDLDVPRLLCLTKIDLLCEEVHDDLTKTFYSVKVRDAVKKASEIFKLPESNIHPIKNYQKEVDTKIPVDMLLMYPLRQALDFATDFLEEQD